MITLQLSFGAAPDDIPVAARRLALAAAFGLVAALGAACTGTPEEKATALGLVEGFAGVVVADEPRAAVLARDVLGNGGTAADAAVAMYFAMTVTLPSRVGIGGGGACLVFDNSEAKAEALLFLPRAVESGGVVPRGARAMAALHARHGLVRWELLIAPAEALARFGHPVSRAFVHDLNLAAERIAANPQMAAIFRNSAGELPDEGDKIVQLELSGVLSGLRAQGAGYLHSGAFMERLVDATAAAGQPVTNEEIRAAVPIFTDPLAVPLGDHTLLFTPPPAADGLVAAQLWQILADDIDLAAAGSGERAHQFLETAGRAFADRAGWMAADGAAREVPQQLLDESHLSAVMAGYDAAGHTPADALSPPPLAVAESPYGASFVVVDRWDNAVACSLTMNGLFGAFRVAPGTGILLAATPADYDIGGNGGNGVLSPSAVILANIPTGEVYLAAAASGGSAAPTALVAVLLGALLDEAPLEEVQKRPRLHTSGAPDIAFYEAGVAPELRQSLAAQGHLLREAPPLGQVTAIYCADSAHRSRGDCQYARDPRGWGLGMIAQ